MAERADATAAAANRSLPDSTSGEGLSGDLSEIMGAAEGTPSGTLSGDVHFASFESGSRLPAALNAATDFPLPLGDVAPAAHAAPSRPIPAEGFPMPTPSAVPKALGTSMRSLTPPRATNVAPDRDSPRTRTPRHESPINTPPRQLAFSARVVRGVPPVPSFDSPPSGSLRGAITARPIPKSVPVFPMTPRSEPQAIALKDLTELDIRIREWVSQQFQSRDFYKSQMFNRAQEAGRQLEDKIDQGKAQSFSSLSSVH